MLFYLLIYFLLLLLLLRLFSSISFVTRAVISTNFDKMWNKFSILVSFLFRFFSISSLIERALIFEIKWHQFEMEKCCFLLIVIWMLCILFFPCCNEFCFGPLIGAKKIISITCRKKTVGKSQVDNSIEWSYSHTSGRVLFFRILGSFLFYSEHNCLVIST